MGGACALIGRAANNRNDRENVPALNTLDHKFPSLRELPPAKRDRRQLGAKGLAEIRAVLWRRGTRNCCRPDDKSPVQGFIHE